MGERGGSHRESSLLPLGHLRVIYDSQPHGYALFIAIRIRVKGDSLSSFHDFWKYIFSSLPTNLHIYFFSSSLMGQPHQIIFAWRRYHWLWILKKLYLLWIFHVPSILKNPLKFINNSFFIWREDSVDTSGSFHFLIKTSSSLTDKNLFCRALTNWNLISIIPILHTQFHDWLNVLHCPVRDGM